MKAINSTNHNFLKHHFECDVYRWYLSTIKISPLMEKEVGQVLYLFVEDEIRPGLGRSLIEGVILSAYES